MLSLGWGYLSSLNLQEIAQPLMEELVQHTGESCSVATLDVPDIVYVARVPTRRIMSITLGLGTRLPAHATSMGRVLLAGLPTEDGDGRVVAAINVSAAASRVALTQLRGEFRPALIHTAEAVSAALGSSRAPQRRHGQAPPATG